MGKPTGFLEFDRQLPKTRDPKQRISDFHELYVQASEDLTNQQAARCMDCGVPFCHTGCPLGNIIPDFNDAVYHQDWALAAEILYSTNNFPEFTGRICPAPCEASCVLGINKPPVAIEFIEKMIAEKSFELGLVKPQPPEVRTGKKVAVVGSGPAGLAAAAQLNKAGHFVVVFERSDRIGGLLRYGIPDFKLEKKYVDRRLKVMEEEGIIFKTKANIGVNVPMEKLMEEFDAIVLCGGSTVPRDLKIPGRHLNGVHYAMDFLTQQNKRIAGDSIAEEETISAAGKHVVVIGGGDTGSDCVGTSNRHQAKSVTQIELLAKPPAERSDHDPWPKYPMILRTSSSHEEGCDRHWSIYTKEFVGDAEGNLKGMKIVDIKWEIGLSGKPEFREIPGTEREIPCELALLAIGFMHGETSSMSETAGFELDKMGNVKASDYQTNVEKIFTAGDMRRGQSLVVWAIAEGREAAYHVDRYLMGESNLEKIDESMINVRTHMLQSQ
jgi:glutamate synthase (NADPH/NADH) small chain